MDVVDIEAIGSVIMGKVLAVRAHKVSVRCSPLRESAGSMRQSWNLIENARDVAFLIPDAWRCTGSIEIISAILSLLASFSRVLLCECAL